MPTIPAPGSQRAGPPAQAWNAAAWSTLGPWCGWGTDVQLFAYDYGNNITYQGDEVYYGDQPVATAAEYYQEASTLAQSAPPPDPQSADWLSLGVFSLVQGDQTDSNTMFQLAVSKTGAIAGNYYNVLTESTLPVHGAVDKKTQRAAWTVGDNKATVYDAGIGSLTEDEGAGVAALRQGSNTAVDAGPAKTAGTGQQRAVTPIDKASSMKQQTAGSAKVELAGDRADIGKSHAATSQSTLPRLPGFEPR